MAASLIPIEGQDYIKRMEMGATSFPAGSPAFTVRQVRCSNQWLTGWGTTVSTTGKPSYTSVTPQQAEQLFQQDVNFNASYVLSLVKKPLTPQQLTACTDFSYWHGNTAFAQSGIAQALNAGNVQQAAQIMRNYTGGPGTHGYARDNADAQLLTGGVPSQYRA